MAQMQKCQSCGAVIYPEHIDQGRAGLWAGQMLCTVCYAEKRGGGAAQAQSGAAGSAGQSQAREEEPLSLVEGVEETGEPKIQAFGQQITGIGPQRRTFARKPGVTGTGACRVRTFHAKIQAESIEFMDNAINEWLDANPDIEVKFVTSTIGVMAGKHPEPNLILNIWY